MPTNTPRIVTIDGPSGTGKGTIARLLAASLGGWHTLDSGAIYRAVGLVAMQRGLDPTDSKLPILAANLNVEFVSEQIFLDGVDISDAIRTEISGAMASKVAAIPAIRTALLARLRAYAKHPGLVADGRDMGTLVFPEAQVKIFLTASPEERAKRRYNQLKEKGLNANLIDLATDLRERDERDRTRSTAPLKAAAAALEVETTGHSIDAVLKQVLALVIMTFPDLQT